MSIPTSRAVVASFRHMRHQGKGCVYFVNSPKSPFCLLSSLTLILTPVLQIGFFAALSSVYLTMSEGLSL